MNSFLLFALKGKIGKLLRLLHKDTREKKLFTEGRGMGLQRPTQVNII